MDTCCSNSYVLKQKSVCVDVASGNELKFFVKVQQWGFLQVVSRCAAVGAVGVQVFGVWAVWMEEVHY